MRRPREERAPGAWVARRESLAGYLMAAPSAALLFGVALIPSAATAWFSLFRLIVVFHEHRFIGLGNYRTLAGDARFWTSLGNAGRGPTNDNECWLIPANLTGIFGQFILCTPAAIAKTSP